MLYWPAKAPGEVEDFAFDFTDALEDGETIATKNVTAEGVTVDSSAIAGSQVQLWLSGGTAGGTGVVVCTITTSGSRTYSETAVVAIGEDPVSLAMAKAHLRVEDDSDDMLIGAYLAAARSAVENATSKLLTARTVSQTVDRFPCREGAIRLWKGPASAILAVKYDDGGGDEQTLIDYRLVEGGSARLLPSYGNSWPISAIGAGAVRVTYTAGYAAGEVPSSLIQAVLLLTGHFYANREGVVTGASSAAAMELPLGVEALIRPFRSVGIG